MGHCAWKDATLNTGLVTNGYSRYFVQGNVCTVVLCDITVSSIPSGTGTVLVSGLPKAIYDFATVLVPITSGTPKRIKLKTDGTIVFHYAGTLDNPSQMQASISYLCQ